MKIFNGYFEEPAENPGPGDWEFIEYDRSDRAGFYWNVGHGCTGWYVLTNNDSYRKQFGINKCAFPIDNVAIAWYKENYETVK